MTSPQPISYFDRAISRNRRIQFRSAALQDLHRFANSDNPDPVAALPGGQRVWLMTLDQCGVPGCHRHSDTLRFYR